MPSVLGAWVGALGARRTGIVQGRVSLTAKSESPQGAFIVHGAGRSVTRSKTAMLSTCAVWGNMLMTPACVQV